MKFMKTIATSTVLMVGMAVSASAATFGLNTTGGTARSLDAGYSLPVPALPFEIFDFQGNSNNGSFGGLTVTPGSRLKATYLGSEAGATNGATLALGGFSFSNATSAVNDFVIFQNTGVISFVDLAFTTNNLGGSDTIDNDQGTSTDSRLHIAFTDIRGAIGDVTSVFAFFGDGAGDQDYDDMVIRLDIVPVPVPAAGLLLLAALGGLTAMRRRRKAA